VSQISAPARNGKVIGRIPVQEKNQNKKKKENKTEKQQNKTTTKQGTAAHLETLYEKSGRAG
jgi:hypothetical protein